MFSPGTKVTAAAAAALALLALPGVASVAAGAPGEFAFTAGQMNVARAHAAVVKMADGRVLVAGGYAAGLATSDTATPTAEIYDPSTGTFTPTGSMSTPRGVTKGVLLANGKVLVVGGQTHTGGPWNSGEIYDPASGTFSPAANTMNGGRVWPLALRLSGGQVLVGFGCCSGVTTADLFDQGTNAFTPTGNPTADSVPGTMTALADGRVLVTGGWGGTAAQVYDPAAQAFQATGSMHCRRYAPVAVRLADNRVLVAGGVRADDVTPPCDTASAEIWNPATGTWTFTAGLMSSKRVGAWATLLPGGKVLVAGGTPAWGGAPVASADIYDPATDSFAPTGSLRTARRQWGTSDTVTLDDGRILLVGGAGDSEAAGEGHLATAELYTPAGLPPAASARPAGSDSNAADRRRVVTVLSSREIRVRAGRFARARLRVIRELRFDRTARFSFYVTDRQGRRVPLSPGSQVGTRRIPRTFYAPVVQDGRAGAALLVSLTIAGSRAPGGTLHVVERTPDGALARQELAITG